MSPVFSVSVTGTSISQQIDSTPGTIEVVETVEEMSSSSFGDNIREEQLDAIMVESIEELANTSEQKKHFSAYVRGGHFLASFIGVIEETILATKRFYSKNKWIRHLKFSWWFYYLFYHNQ